MKNITFSADEKIIESARKRAKLSGSTLNDDFRQWLADKALSPTQRAEQYRKLMRHLSYVNAGRKFTREEMNER